MWIVAPRSGNCACNCVLALTGPSRSWPLLIAAGAWTIFAIYEWWFETDYDPQRKISIRVDLLFLLFCCIVATLLCAIWALFPLRR